MFSFHKYFVRRDIIENLIISLFSFDVFNDSDGSYGPKRKFASTLYI